MTLFTNPVDKEVTALPQGMSGGRPLNLPAGSGAPRLFISCGQTLDVKASSLSDMKILRLYTHPQPIKNDLYY